MTDIVWIVSVLTAYFLGYWVGEYGPPLFRLLDGVKLPQLRWPWHYSEADAYTKKYCSDEQALARASEEAWQQARVGKDRTMGPLVVGNWPPKPLHERVTALEDWRVWFEVQVPRQIAELRERLEAATLSHPTASPTREVPSDAAEQDYTPRLSPASWRSGLATTTGGPAAPVSDSAQETDVPT